MKVLITGSSGFIGSHVARAFAARGDEIFGIDIVAPRDQTYAFAACNILDLERLKKTFAAFEPEVIVHLAARIDLDGRTLDDYRENFDGVANIVEAVRNTPSV